MIIRRATSIPSRRIGLCFAVVVVGLAVGVTISAFLTETQFVESKGASDDNSHWVTEDIQAGIEKHIEEQTKAGNGYFRFHSAGMDYAFKLVRVHTEYLSKLGPRRHFACVDLVDTGGDVYDVDFFLDGDPGAMTVSEATLHKLNGIPYYAWKQGEDGTWARVPADSSTQKLLEIVERMDRFEFRYSFDIPKLSAPARMWLPFPRSDSYQTITLNMVDAPAPHKVIEEDEYGNRLFFFELGPKSGGKNVEIRFEVARKEKSAYASSGEDPTLFLASENLAPITDDIRRIARDVVKGKNGDLVRARALYDHVIDRMRYMKYGDGWGRGDAVYACDQKSGNCTDFHAYFMSLARSVGIPARFAIGAAIPASRNDGGIDGYHCWVEFHAESKWWPVDISEADKYAALATYFFGHHPANRIELSRGRDLEVEPGPEAGPINFLAYPVLEVAGKQVRVVPRFSFKRKGVRLAQLQNRN